MPFQNNFDNKNFGLKIWFCDIRFWIAMTENEIMQLKGHGYCKLRNNTIKIRQYKQRITFVNYLGRSQC